MAVLPNKTSMLLAVTVFLAVAVCSAAGAAVSRTTSPEEDILAKQRPLTPSTSGMFGKSYSITRTFQDGNGLVGSLFEGGIILSREEADLYLGTNTSDILAEYGFVFRHDPTASFRNNNDRQLGMDEGIADENSKLWTDRSSNGKLRVPYSFSRSRNVV